MEALYNIFIYPVYALIELFFYFSYRITFGDTLFCIVAVSFLVNLVCLPLYIRAEIIQKEEKDIQKKLEPMVKSIKKNFKGNERFMLLSTYYRQNNYHPVMALRTSISLLLQIVFFFAAYKFFSSTPAFPPIPFGLDFYKPDGLLYIGNFRINVLPIVMTVINLISANIYIRKINDASKLQMYSFAFIFLVLLYNSPSILVIYWTMNNIFSLLKNIGLASKSPKKFLFTILIIFASLFLFHSSRVYSTILNPVYLTFAFSCIAYMVMDKFKEFFDKKADFKLFLISLIAFCVFAGLFCTINVISSSPLEFAALKRDINPLFFVYDSSFKFIGVCFWFLILYYLCNNRIRNMLTILMTSIFMVQLINILTSTKIGLINSDMSLDESLIKGGIIKNTILSLVFAIIPVILIIKNKVVFLKKISCALIISVLCFCLYKTCEIQKAYNYSKTSDEMTSKHWFNLSKKDKNVLILMLDSGMGVYTKEVFEKTPELKDKYNGFILYPNTISYYGHTILGYPAMIGGYEYNPYNMNKRKELMKDKYNESSLVLPVLFKNNGYKTTVINPRMADFKFKGNDKKVFGSRGIKSFYTRGYKSVLLFEKAKDNFFLFDIFSSLPLFIKKDIVSLSKAKNNVNALTLSQVPKAIRGIKLASRTVPDYAQLEELTDRVKIVNKGKSFVVFHNDLLHYDRYGSDFSEEHYILHQEAFKTLGEFLDYLKENNLYDNTRIIIVSDHGRHKKKNIYNLNEEYTDYNPLLMYKDFNSKGAFKTDNKFMTNADCPLIALKDIINPINPFTKKSMKGAVDKENIYIISDGQDDMVGNLYSPSDYPSQKCILKEHKIFKVKNNIFDDKNWHKIKNNF